MSIQLQDAKIIQDNQGYVGPHLTHIRKASNIITVWRSPMRDPEKSVDPGDKFQIHTIFLKNIYIYIFLWEHWWVGLWVGLWNSEYNMSHDNGETIRVENAGLLTPGHRDLLPRNHWNCGVAYGPMCNGYFWVAALMLSNWIKVSNKWANKNINQQNQPLSSAVSLFILFPCEHLQIDRISYFRIMLYDVSRALKSEALFHKRQDDTVTWIGIVTPYHNII